MGRGIASLTVGAEISGGQSTGIKLDVEMVKISCAYGKPSFFWIVGKVGSVRGMSWDGGTSVVGQDTYFIISELLWGRLTDGGRCVSRV